MSQVSFVLETTARFGFADNVEPFGLLDTVIQVVGQFNNLNCSLLYNLASLAVRELVDNDALANAIGEIGRAHV